MLSIILTLLIGLFIAFFAIQNSDLATVHIANYTFDRVPLYLVIIVSLLIGFLVAWLLSLIDFISSALRIFGKDRKLTESSRTVDALNEKIHSLEVENAQLNERIKVVTHKGSANRM